LYRSKSATWQFVTEYLSRWSWPTRPRRPRTTPPARTCSHRSTSSSLELIREAALASFARDGAARTTVRRVADDAGVSPGLVQHYFPAKADLRGAVDAYVLALAREAFANVTPSVEEEDVVDEFGRRIATFVRDHGDVVRYVARSAFDEGAAPRLFDGFVEVARIGWAELSEQRLVRADLDLTWSALHIVILNLGTVLFEAAVDRQLPDSLRTPSGLERWRSATTALFRSGAYRSAAVADGQ
jgi:AcrR family transcriptional regulator